MNNTRTFHRLGEPGGPCCPVGVLPIGCKDTDGLPMSAQLLDGGLSVTEVEMLRTVASRLGVVWGQDQLGWWAVVPGAEFPSWAVWRQDDSGNRYLVEANLTHSEARVLVEQFTARGHEQTYWSEDMKQDTPA